jgi:hypothetical protein
MRVLHLPFNVFYNRTGTCMCCSCLATSFIIVLAHARVVAGLALVLRLVVDRLDRSRNRQVRACTASTGSHPARYPAQPRYPARHGIPHGTVRVRGTSAGAFFSISLVAFAVYLRGAAGPARGLGLPRSAYLPRSAAATARVHLGAALPPSQ